MVLLNGFEPLLLTAFPIFEPLLLIAFPIFCHILNSPEFASRASSIPLRTTSFSSKIPFVTHYLWENLYFRDDGKRKGWQPTEKKNSVLSSMLSRFILK